MKQGLIWRDLLTIDPDDPRHAWQAFRNGVDILPLHGDPSEGGSCALLRYQPGAQVPRHMHQGMECLLVLRGSQCDDGGCYSAGTFMVNPADSAHGISSPEGCVVLAIWEQPVRFLS